MEHLWDLNKVCSKGLEEQFVFIKYLLLLIIFDHYKEYSLIKETQWLGKYLISEGEQFIFALVSREKGNCDCMFFSSLLDFMERFHSVHGKKNYVCS